MLIENEFQVPAPIERVWAYLLHVERVAPCMPGAELTETIDDSNWKGKVRIKLGPVSLSFAGTVTMLERDDDAHRVVLEATGMEQRGKGAATALVTMVAEAVDGGTRIHLTQDLTISGMVAQYSRGMMQDVSSRLIKQFASCLEATLSVEEEIEEKAGPAEAPGDEDSGAEPAGGEPRPTPAPRTQAVAAPVKGFRLGVWALWRAVVRAFERWFGSPGR